MKKQSTQNFYDLLSADYDLMINFDAALERRKELLNNFIQPGSGDAADLGCGSGLDSITLVKLGYNVTGFDISESMIIKSKENAEKSGTKIEFYSTPIDKINKRFYNKFSIALSLGNSLANINEIHLAKSLSKIYSILQPGGRILIQILNYNRIIKEKERIVGITENGDYTFVRFYDFIGTGLLFNILRFNRKGKKQRSLITTRIYPYKSDEIIKMIYNAGFKKVKKFGGLDKSRYSLSKSTDLVIEAFK